MVPAVPACSLGASGGTSGSHFLFGTGSGELVDEGASASACTSDAATQTEMESSVRDEMRTERDEVAAAMAALEQQRRDMEQMHALRMEALVRAARQLKEREAAVAQAEVALGRATLAGSRGEEDQRRQQQSHS